MSQANRYNLGKLRWDLVDWSSTEEMVKVLEAGANKYSADNWKQGLHREEILESMQRHLVSLFKKEEIDPDLGTFHAANIMCNAMFYLHFARNKSFKSERNNPFSKNPSIGLTGSNSPENKKQINQQTWVTKLEFRKQKSNVQKVRLHWQSLKPKAQ